MSEWDDEIAEKKGSKWTTGDDEDQNQMCALRYLFAAKKKSTLFCEAYSMGISLFYLQHKQSAQRITNLQCFAQHNNS